MRRRNFIKNLSAGTSGLFIAASAKGNDLSNKPGLPAYSYGIPSSLKEVVNQDGQIMIRLAVTGGEEIKKTDFKSRIKVKNGNLHKIKNYYFEYGEDSLNEQKPGINLSLAKGNRDIIVLWLDKFNAETRVSLGQKSLKLDFTLQELIKEQDIIAESKNVSVSANFLLDKEIGKIKPSDAGIKDTGSEYVFLAMADPQGGDAFATEKLRTRMRIHNAFIEESVALANRINVDPAFTIVIGDITDGWGAREDFAQMNKYLSALKTPVLYEIGNHETELHQKFSPGYNMEGFNNYMAAQKQMNGLEKLLYSFDLGEYHYIVWPDPLREGFWENHPHYFDWLEKDLEAHKDMPVIVFHHVPAQPIGISPHIGYAESVFVKRSFIDTLATHGNVRYVLSGHVHIPVKSSFKTAISHKGMKFINLPAAGYRPRAFGEADYYGGPPQGIAIINVQGKDVKITYKTVTEEEFDYPDKLPEFDEKTYALWLHHKWELAHYKTIKNGDFSDNLNHWYKRYVYTEDENPSNICEAVQLKGKPALYLYTRRRDYMAPGQDRLPQDINRIANVFKIDKGNLPHIRFAYRLDGENCDFDGHAGAFMWIEGFSGSYKVMNLMYSAGKIWYNVASRFSDLKRVPYVELALNEEVDVWHQGILNLAADFNRQNNKEEFKVYEMDTIAINLGIWNINDGKAQPFAAYFSDFELVNALQTQSTIDGTPIKLKNNEKDVWWRNKTVKSTNIAGEHRYWLATDPKYTSKK